MTSSCYLRVSTNFNCRVHLEIGTTCLTERKIEFCTLYTAYRYSASGDKGPWKDAVKKFVIIFGK